MQWGRLIAALLILLQAGPVSAAVLYRVSGISDINLPSWSIGDPAVHASIDVCAYTSLAGNYAVTAAAVGGFQLYNGLDTIPYTLTWEDSGAGNLGVNAGSTLNNGVSLTSQAHSNSSLISTDCSNGAPAGNNARLYLTITQAAMTSAVAGTYTGTLTLTISAL